ncbi:MAG: hypothetical protein IMF05_10555 [Proteobacteria bacterium]|nr:hypothetical protein [Pseudomonadota bacterium]
MTTELITEAQIEEAWRKAKPASGRNPRLFRIAPDVIQSIIRRDKYNVCGEFGWRIEHGKPVSYRKTSIEEAMKLVQSEILAPCRPTIRKTNSGTRN